MIRHSCILSDTLLSTAKECCLVTGRKIFCNGEHSLFIDKIENMKQCYKLAIYIISTCRQLQIQLF